MLPLRLTQAVSSWPRAVMVTAAFAPQFAERAVDGRFNYLADDRVYCRRSCAETLRVETVDFFETNAAGSGQLTNECGVFGCLDLKYPR